MSTHEQAPAGRPTDPATSHAADHATDRPLGRKDVVAREKQRYGGVKVVCAFFGWLTATGMTVLLTALLAAIGAGVGLVSSASDVAGAASDRGISTEEIGWAGVVLVLVVVFVSYYSGGYVAGRMARFDGARQGAAVFAWAVVAAIVVAVLGAIGGAQFDVLDQLNSFPRIPGSLSDLSLAAVVALVGVVVASLVGAVLGGLAGMHFHRKVDRTGLGR
ncbi:hypothetical protein ASG49_00610 [Marmoricola sp. Leaf446]|uniref:hypothetical protein n=1 Tax=Marmoricola sp. Leaf446 TaxID=1736379 RepID=UPI0006FA1F63|nr:hypothetical protein [Marmoricola sp. Leaf446]KQT93548.1 hypothetical protein ASG49_00610 [Marmoricola sp. Leaf446]